MVNLAMNNAMVQSLNLTKHYEIEGGLLSSLVRSKRPIVHAVCDVNLTISRGETLGLVGESGSGKSTIGRCILGLIEPTNGKIIFDGNDITNLSKRRHLKVNRQMQAVFQNPFLSLNPRKKIRDIVGHPLELHGMSSGEGTKEQVRELFEAVGLNPEHMDRYPHQFSGGQKQRIAIARALALKPKFIVADEAVSALDVSIQAQILNLLAKLKDEFDLTILFIAHNIDVVQHVSHRIAVMYLGKIVEVTDTKRIFEAPAHPYTQALLSAIPIPDPRRRKDWIPIQGEIPNPINPPSGCRFRTRCPQVMDVCSKEEPKLKQIKKGQFTACHLY